MNLLIDELPASLWIGDAEYVVNSDFRVSILFELLMQDPEVPGEWKLPLALRLYFPVCPADPEEAAAAMLWFYKCGKDPLVLDDGSGGSMKQIYSFDFDDGYIYAAFLEQYGIDLADVEYLHWWKFRAMFHSLKEDTMIRKIMYYRAVDTTGMSAKEQEEYRKIKEQYRIPLPRSEQEKLDAIEQALLTSGDLTGLL